jgi:hypothetical protein
MSRKAVVPRLLVGVIAHDGVSRPVSGWFAADEYGGWLLTTVPRAAPSSAPTRRHCSRNVSTAQHPKVGIGAGGEPQPRRLSWLPRLNLGPAVPEPAAA